MANYYGHYRSNYFTVKDVPAFVAWCERLGMEPMETGSAHGKDVKQNPVGFLMGEDDDSGGLPTTRAPLDADGAPDYLAEEEEVDFVGELAEQLAEGQVAVVMEVGHEKLRYLYGHAFAVNDAGDTVGINLRDVYALAQELAGEGVTVTPAEY